MPNSDPPAPHSDPPAPHSDPPVPHSDAPAANLAGSSMRKIALTILCFLAPLLPAWAALEWWAAQMPTSHAVKRENLRRLEDEIDTLIIGSSSAYWDVSPELLPGSAFNLANVAQSLYYDDQLLAEALPKLPRLRRVILSVTYLSLFFQLHDSDEDERQYYYYQEWDIPPPRFRERLDVRMWSRVALRTPVTTFESLVGALRGSARTRGPLVPGPLDPPVDERGWCAREPGDPKDLDPSVVEAKLKYHHGLMHLSDQPANVAYLEHMIGLLAARHIELILVTPPVAEAYSSRLKPAYWNRTRDTLAELARAPNVRYFSFLTAPKFPVEEFLDADHLNRQGAVRFTALLEAAIESGAAATKARE
jgi:hypothetical protein